MNKVSVYNPQLGLNMGLTATELARLKYRETGEATPDVRIGDLLVDFVGRTFILVDFYEAYDVPRLYAGLLGYEAVPLEVFDMAAFSKQVSIDDGPWQYVLRPRKRRVRA